MTMIRTAGARLGMPATAVLALLVAGCGTHRVEDPADAYRRTHPTPTGISRPSTPADFPCPGESPTPAPPPAAGISAAPGDHYAENHGFRVPFPLHGRSRCDGLAAVRRIEGVLEPLRESGDFAPESTSRALTGLGYPAAKVRSYEMGPTAVGFLVEADAAPLCVEGTMGRDATEAHAFGGYPDHSGCDTPSGGH
ncbi:hypothetical protein PZB75_06390 [Streptomyces sp. AM 4-1-1]|uniref:hypothetical protein n=1 Tax=Streptomyces sp. AM 4-1-1 TaxID=3028710 RepID=UPI0023B97D1B|nr:hypothetical protein [Streptomyces sp. AM 4-1-1]WEH33039.1 hypothetical protein PZB75_06390 [Streptomyces sp. AM 4-1-1]